MIYYLVVVALNRMKVSECRAAHQRMHESAVYSANSIACEIEKRFVIIENDPFAISRTADMKYHSIIRLGRAGLVDVLAQ